ncbi:MAG: hypothetical protein ACOYEH_01340, partial [Caldicoprobacterales bacterium]
MKSFLRQIKYEIISIIRSRFLLIIAILLIAASAVFPVINLFAGQRQPDYGIVRPLPMGISRKAVVDMPAPIPGFPGTNQESITIDGVTINSDNPFFWQITSIIQEKEFMESDRDRFSSPEALDLALSLLDEEIQFYLNFARHITEYTDYRSDLVWRSQESLYDKFIFEHIDAPEEALLEAISQRRYMEEELFRTKYIALSSEDRLAALEKAEEELNTLYTI